jgi:hypothetical protein
VHWVSTLEPPAQSPEGVRWDTEVGGHLRRALEAEPGSVMLMSSINGGDRVIWRSHVDASRFLTEFNGERFEAALQRPRRHARLVLLAPGSTVAARHDVADFQAMGYELVWSHELYGSESERYALLRKRGL